MKVSMMIFILMAIVAVICIAKSNGYLEKFTGDRVTLRNCMNVPGSKGSCAGGRPCPSGTTCQDGCCVSTCQSCRMDNDCYGPGIGIRYSLKQCQNGCCVDL